MSYNKKKNNSGGKKQKSLSQRGSQDNMDIIDRSFPSVQVDGETIKRNDLVVFYRSEGQETAVVRNLYEDASSERVFTGQLVVASAEGDQYYFTHVLGTFPVSSINSKLRHEGEDLTNAYLKFGYNYETEEIVEIAKLPSQVEMEEPPLTSTFNVPRRETSQVTSKLDLLLKFLNEKGVDPEKLEDLGTFVENSSPSAQDLKSYIHNTTLKGTPNKKALIIVYDKLFGKVSFASHKDNDVAVKNKSPCGLCDGSGEGSIVSCTTCHSKYHKGCLPDKIAELAVAESEVFECWNCSIADPTKVVLDMNEQDFADRMIVWSEASAVDAIFGENFYENILPSLCLKVYESEHADGEPFRNLISYFVASPQVLDSHLRPLSKLLPLKHSDVRAAVEKAWKSDDSHSSNTHDEITSIFANVFCLSIKCQRSLRPDQLSVVDNFDDFDKASKAPLEVEAEDRCHRALRVLLKTFTRMSKAFGFSTEFAALQEIEKRVIHVEHFDEQVYQNFKVITDNIREFPQNVLDKDLDLHKFTRSHEMLGEWIRKTADSYKALSPEIQELQKLHYHCSDIPLFVNSVRQTIASIRNSIQQLQRESKSMLEKSTNQIKERVDIQMYRVADWHEEFIQNLRILNKDIQKQNANLKAWCSTKLVNVADERRVVYEEMVAARDDYLQNGTKVEALLENLLSLDAPEVISTTIILSLNSMKTKVAETSAASKSPAAKSPTLATQFEDSSSSKPKSLKRAAVEDESAPLGKSPKKAKTKARRQDTPMPKALRAAAHTSQVSPQLASQNDPSTPPFPKSRLTFDDGAEAAGDEEAPEDETNGHHDVTMID